MENQEKKQADKVVDKKILEYLGIRDHSRLELRKKLMRKFTAEEADKALDRAQASGWLPTPETLASRVADQLRRRGKGHLYVLAYLKKKGLPAVARDEDVECQNARNLIVKKFAARSSGERARILRFLAGRGFDREVIRKVCYERR